MKTKGRRRRNGFLEKWEGREKRRKEKVEGKRGNLGGGRKEASLKEDREGKGKREKRE